MLFFFKAEEMCSEQGIKEKNKENIFCAVIVVLI